MRNIVQMQQGEYMGYFDLQVNGYGGVDFNQGDLSADKLHQACAKLREDGVEGILATFITETVDVMYRRVARLADLRNRDPLAREVIAGIHVEGPFISPVTGFVGAHPKDAVLPATPEVAAKLLDAGAGLVRLVTLAPESDDGFRTTSFLAKQDVRVAAGHTDASIDQLRGACDAGLSLFTHLGNGCPMQMHRHDNIIQRALHLRERLWICFIADGVHVPFVALRNYIDLIGINRVVVVTDAVAPAGMGPGRYRLSRWDLLIGEDMVARAPDGSHFVGSAITMKQSASNISRNLGMNQEQTDQVTQTQPREAVGL